MQEQNEMNKLLDPQHKEEPAQQVSHFSSPEEHHQQQVLQEEQLQEQQQQLLLLQLQEGTQLVLEFFVLFVSIRLFNSSTFFIFCLLINPMNIGLVMGVGPGGGILNLLVYLMT